MVLAGQTSPLPMVELVTLVAVVVVQDRLMVAVVVVVPELQVNLTTLAELVEMD
jgi:hypothetical protein